MKYSTILFISLFVMFNISGLLSGNSCVYAQNNNSHSSHVLVKVPGLTLAQYNIIAKHYMKNAEVEIAYYCLESGIMAIHYNHSGLSSADIRSVVKTQLQKLIKNTNIRILDVEMRSAEDSSRC